MDSLGWTWEYVERHMDLHRYAALRRRWRRSPPVQMMVQAYLEIEPQEDPAPASASPLQPQDEQAAIADFARAFAAAGGQIH